MSGFIPQEKISEIRLAASIVDVVSQYVALKKTGKNFIGLCPFHGEKAPSFTVSQEKQIFHCFGCGQGGNVFNFIMLYQNIGFPEAVRLVGQKYGIEISEKHLSPSQKKEIEERRRLFDVNKAACQYYHKALRASGGHVARDYLKKRNIGQDIIERFSLGFAPKGWEHLVRFFSSRGILLKHGEKAGLIISKRDGYYDRFRSRIIFPIMDVHESVLGFGGRSLDDSLPKYLNSPETPIYHKGSSLYGLSLSREACRREQVVHIVEGYFDLLALCAHGIENVVATLGTALTKEHIRILKGYAERAVLVFDSDEAGIKAAQRSLPLFVDEHVAASVIALPEGHDPDSFVFEFGGEAFLELSGKAMDMVDFLIASTIKQHGLSLQGKVNIVEALKGPLAALTDGVTRSVYVRHLAERLDIDENAILGKMRETLSNPQAKFSRGPEEKRETCKLERAVVSVMLRSPDLLSDFNMKKIVESLETKALRHIGKMIMAEIAARGAVTGSELVAQTKDPEIRNLISSLSMGTKIIEREGCVGIMRQYIKNLDKKKKQSLSRKIKEAEMAKDETLVFELLAEKQRGIRKNLEPIGE